MRTRIGYMQGRLVDQVNGKIQAFPYNTWRDEFPVARRIGIPLMEWTLDDFQLEQNPLCTAAGQEEVRQLSSQYGLTVCSITGDCFMQAPFWKCEGAQQAQLLKKLDLVIAASGTLAIKCIVIPLVDNGGLENAQQTQALLSQLMARHAGLLETGVHIAFESDYAPLALKEFIALFPSDRFGVNYDIGNSASMGFDPVEEMTAYGNRITNVHVKDRLRGGTTVPLGTGAAKMGEVFCGLKANHYRGNFVLQTARAVDGKHEETLARYAAWTEALLEPYFGA